MNNIILDTVKECRNAIKIEPMHHLPLPLRKKLWLAFGPIELGKHEIARRTSAYQKRITLALLSCEKVLPIWKKLIPGSDIPEKALQYAAEYLNDSSDADATEEKLNSLYGGLQNTEGLTDEQINATMVGYACIYAAYLTIFDESCEDIEKLDQHYDAWETSMHAAGAYSGGFPWLDNPKSDPQKLYEFWTWYLDEAEKLADT